MKGERPCSGQAAIFSSRVAGENIGPVSRFPIIVVAGITTPRAQTGHSAFGLDVYERGRDKVPHSRLKRPSTLGSLAAPSDDASPVAMASATGRSKRRARRGRAPPRARATSRRPTTRTSVRIGAWFHQGVHYVGIQCPGDEPPCHLAGLVTLTAKLIDELALTRATVDGFSDCRDLPLAAVKALARLEEVASENHERDATRSRWHRWLRRKGPTNMAVEFHLSAPDRYAVEGSAPYSIHAELHDDSGLVEVVLHDSGTGVSISTDTAAHEALVARVLDEVQATYEQTLMGP